jgi:hypothetical protein
VASLWRTHSCVPRRHSCRRHPANNVSPLKCFWHLASLADEEEAWKKSFVEKRDVIRRMAREAFQEDERGETRPLGDLL